VAGCGGWVLGAGAAAGFGGGGTATGAAAGTGCVRAGAGAGDALVAAATGSFAGGAGAGAGAAGSPASPTAGTVPVGASAARASVVGGAGAGGATGTSLVAAGRGGPVGESAWVLRWVLQPAASRLQRMAARGVGLFMSRPGAYQVASWSNGGTRTPAGSQPGLGHFCTVCTCPSAPRPGVADRRAASGYACRRRKTRRWHGGGTPSRITTPAAPSWRPPAPAGR
jgi:hypothetical protein